jgi:type I restriction enzyme S subunit
MSSEWDLVPLGSVAEIVMGQSPPGTSYNGDGNGVPLLNGPTEFGSRHPVVTVHTSAPTKIARRGDVLFCVRGSTTGRMNIADREYCLGRGVAAVRGASPEATAFIHAILTARLLSLLILVSGSTFPNLSRSDLATFVVPWPPPDEQRRIAGVLGALDDKIEHNRARSARLMDCARLIFEHWFRSVTRAPRVRVAELIASNRLVVNDGYRAKNSEMAAEGVPFLRGGNVNDDLELGGVDLLGHDGVARAGDKVSRVGDAFFTAKGTVGRIGRVSRWTPKFVYSPQIAFWRSLDEHALAPEYLYLWLSSRDFIGQRDAVKGQTDMADYVNLRDQRAMAIAVPEPERQRELTSVVRPVLDSEALARTEARRLSAIRDTLLPKLVSGQIRVPESYDPE